MSQKSETKPQEEPKITTYLTLLKDNNDAVAMYFEGILCEAELIECSDVPEKFISNSLPIFYGLIAMKYYKFNDIPYPMTYAVLMQELPTEEEEFTMIMAILAESAEKFPLAKREEMYPEDTTIDYVERATKYAFERIREAYKENA